MRWRFSRLRIDSQARARLWVFLVLVLGSVVLLSMRSET